MTKPTLSQRQDQPRGQAAVLPHQTASEARRVLESHVELIHDVIRHVSRRHYLDPGDQEELTSFVMLKLVDNDYGVLRRFQGTSTLRTYLNTVISRLFLDYRIQQWGRWRPSSRARRLGPLAVQLDRLLTRERHTLNDAIEILKTDFQVGASREYLCELAGQLPPRTRPYFSGPEELEQIVVDGSADKRLVEHERSALSGRLKTALAHALGLLPSEDRRILEMKYHRDFTAGQIADAVGIKPRSVYSRLEKTLATLRRRVEAQGLGHADVAQAVG